MSSRLHAGVAATDISPPVGVALSGYGARAGPNVGVHDPVMAKALVLAAGDQALALTTADLVALDAPTVARVRSAVADRTGLPPGHIMVACSHTHSGPATRAAPYVGWPDPAYLALLEGRLTDVAVAAWESRRPAAAAWGQGEAHIGINRRQRLPAGDVVIGRNEAGVVDPRIQVLRVDAADGKPLAVFFTHAVHAVTLGGDNLLVSADWPGAAQRALETLYGGAVTALFGQGCCADINSHPRGTFEIVEEQGRAVAVEVQRVADALRPAPEMPLGAAQVTVGLPRVAPPEPAECRALLARLRAEQRENREQDVWGLRLLREGYVEWAQRTLWLSEHCPEGASVPFEVQALRIGDGAVVGLPAEVFVQYQLAVKAASPWPHTCVLGCANGDIGYLPTAAAHAEGGYEVDSSNMVYVTWAPRPDAEELVLGAAGQALAALRA